MGKIMDIGKSTPRMVLCGLLLVINTVFAATNKPNIIIMLADDLGYGDVGCFGNTTLPTPNIDELTNEGVKLTHHLAASSLCGPSRAALLTGRYAIRSGKQRNCNQRIIGSYMGVMSEQGNLFPSGMVADGRLRVNIFVANRAGMPQYERTIAELAKDVGYKTALIGKWHLGLSKDRYGDNAYHPLKQGFDYYYGHILTNMKDWSGEGDRVLYSQRPYFYYYTIPGIMLGVLSFLWLYSQGYIGKVLLWGLIFLIVTPFLYFVFALTHMTLLNSILMRNYDVVEQPVRLNSLMTRYVREGIEFLEAREKDQSPFLLMLSWDHTHTALKVAKQFRGISNYGRYGDAVMELDWGTGEVMSALKNMGIGKNTMVYFSSDNGGHLEERGVHGEVDGGHNGVFKGGKAQGAVDGGIRVPSSVWFPGRIPSKTVIDEPTMQMDMFTTIANQMGSEIPTDRQIDGKDLFPLLTGKETVSPNDFFFHYCGSELHAVRYRPKQGNEVWKLVFKTPDYLPGQQRCGFVCSCQYAITLDAPHLYEMTSDPGEQQPLQMNSERQKIVKVMIEAVQRHTESITPVDSQLSFYSMMWRPHMQPCCNFPYCDCVDTKYKDLIGFNE